MTSLTPVQHLRLRLYPGLDDDLRLWLAGLAELPFGAKSQAIKTVLRRGLELGAMPAAMSAAPPDLTGWLPEIRRALAAELDQRQWAAGNDVVPTATPETDVVADLLAQLDASLALVEDIELGGGIS